MVNATIDHNGFLWICTAEGLNKYDGRGMENYYMEDYPALRSDNIREVVCDNRNRLWIRSFGGNISMLDEKRQWHSIQIMYGKDSLGIYNIVQTKSRGIVLFRGAKQYVAKPGSDTLFTRWYFPGAAVFNQRLFYSSYISEDEIIWTGNDELFVMNYATGKITFRKKIPGITSAAAYNSHEVYVTTAANGGLYKLELTTGDLQALTSLRDQLGNPMFSSLQMVRKMADSRMIITSAFAGLYLLDPATNKLFRYMHDPLNRRSISGNNYHNLVADSSGYVFIASPTNGLSYFNVNDKTASWIGSVTNTQGELFDGYINAILPAAQPGVFWLGGYNQLLQWNRQTGKAVFFDYGTNATGNPNRSNDEVVSLSNDSAGNVWVGTGNNGIVILNKTGTLTRQIKAGIKAGKLPANRINNLLYSNGSMWVATGAGLCRLNANTGLLIPFENNSVLHRLDSIDCGKLWIDSHKRLWIGTARNGAYCYDPVKQSVFTVARPADSTSMEVFAFEEDDAGDIYVGSRSGLLVVKNDAVIANFSRQNGLRGDRCENLLKDEKGNLWIDNHNCIIRYDPIAKTFAVFDEKSGLSPFGTRPRSSFKNSDGYFFFGNETGFSFFHPDSIAEPKTTIRLSVSSLQHEDGLIPLNSPGIIKLSWFDNQIVFHFAATDLEQSKKIYYRYQLKGFDKQWITETNISSVRYNSLTPGNYTFELMASDDGIKWVSTAYPVQLLINPAYWQTTWFKFGAALLLAVIFYVTLKQREKLINRKALEKAKVEEMRSQALQYQLEIEQVINYFANSLSGLHTVDDALWDVVKTCISQLGFQDCVIYFYNKERTLLMQKAAYGPKNIDYTDIYNRIEIEPGSGIVGHVAKTGIAEIINDTSKDPRYIPDDAVRLSEIAVPLIGSNGLVGVIDSEHPEANFYTNRHLQILTAIGTMVVNKTEQLEAEADSRHKEIEMARLQRDVATLQLTATRAQMNPHFIFNALNSVQQYILQGNTDEANKYLSRFSRLQREILNHCDRPFISLQKEIEMLRMYLQLEQLRFNGTFDFELSAEEILDAEEIRIPPMILQPFVENAIWHGLMPKDGQRKVTVAFTLFEETGMLHCTICDNGIGRKAAADNKVNNLNKSDYVSKGLSLVYQRLQLLQEQMGRTFKAQIEDIKDADEVVTGTRVDVVIFTGF